MRSRDATKLHFAGRLARQVRDADGLLAWCRAQFDVPVRVEQWCGHWMPLARDERSTPWRPRAIGGAGLGRGAVLGASVWDVQHKFRIVIGPLALRELSRVPARRRRLGALQALVRQWVGLEFEWDLRLILARDDVPRAPARRREARMLGLHRLARHLSPQRRCRRPDHRRRAHAARASHRAQRPQAAMPAPT